MPYDFSDTNVFNCTLDRRVQEFMRFPADLIQKYSYPFIGGSGNVFLEDNVDRYNLSFDFRTPSRQHIIMNGRHFFKDTRKSLFLNYGDIPVGLLGFSTEFNVCFVKQIQATKQNAVIYGGGDGLMSADTNNEYLKGFDWRSVLLNSLEILLSGNNKVNCFKISKDTNNKFGMRPSLERPARVLDYDFECDALYAIKKLDLIS